MEKSEKISLLALIVLIGFFFSVLFHYVVGFYLDLKPSYATFLFNPDQAFSDFYDIMFILRSREPYALASRISYVPFGCLSLLPFSLFPYKLQNLILYFVVALSFLFSANYKYFSCENCSKYVNFQNIFILTMLPYPVLCLLDRGNTDMLVLMMIFLFAFYFQKEQSLKSAVFLGIANAMKPYFLLFSILFLFQKRYKEFFLSLFMTGFLTLVSLFVFKGSISEQLSVLFDNLKIFNSLVIAGPLGLPGNSSLFGSFKVLYYFVTNQLCLTNRIVQHLYTIISFTLMILTTFCVYKDNVFWRQITLLTLFVLVSSAITFDYKLVLLFVPIWFFVETKEKTRFDKFYIACFGLLFIPKHYFMLMADGAYRISVQSLINPMIMLVFMGVLIYDLYASLKNAQKTK